MGLTIRHAFFNQQDRWFLWIPCFLGLGILFYFLLETEPNFNQVILLTVGVLCLIAYLIFKKFNWFAYFLGAFIGGFVLIYLRTHALDTFMLSKEVKGAFIQGTVTHIDKKEDAWRITLDTKQNNVPGRVRLTYRNYSLPFKANDKLYVLADLFPVPSQLTPHGFNFRRHMYFQGIGALGRLTMLISHESGSKQSFTDHQRNKIINLISTQFSGDVAAILIALVVGDRSLITDDLRYDFTSAGIAHILAISGLHLSLIAGFIFLLFRRFLSLSPYIAEHYQTKKWAAFLVIPIVGAYLIISGIGIPAQRAFIMITLVMTAILIDRKPFSMHSVALAALIILVTTPESILSASFQLSFAAVIALIAFYESETIWNLNQKLNFSFKWVGYLAGVLATTVIATLATTPFTISTFATYTLQSIPGNLIAIPLMGFIIMPGLFIFIIMGLSGSKGLIFGFIKNFLSLGTEFLIKSAHTIANWPGAAMTAIEPPPLFIIFVAFGGLWICLWQGRLRWVGMGAILLGTGIYATYQPPHLIMAQNMVGFYNDKKLYTLPNHYSDFKVKAWEKSFGVKERTHFTKDIVFSLRDSKNVMILPFEDYTAAYLKYVCDTYDLVISNAPLEFFCPPNRFINLMGVPKDKIYLIKSNKLTVEVIKTDGRLW